MRVAVTGSSGLIGTALCTALEGNGHEVVRLVRHTPSAPNEAQWDVASRTVDESALQDVGAIVNLAGENIGQRWTATVKRRAWESRVDGTGLLAETAARLPGRPVLLCASAVGFTASTSPSLWTRARRVARGSSRNSSRRGRRPPILPARRVSAPSTSARASSSHVTAARFSGCCFRSSSASAARSAAAASGGAGSRSPDVASAYLFALDHALEGPVNVDAPGAVTNAVFTKELGAALHRPTILPAPAFALNAIFGRWPRRRSSAASGSSPPSSGPQDSRSPTPTCAAGWSRHSRTKLVG